MACQLFTDRSSLAVTMPKRRRADGQGSSKDVDDHQVGVEGTDPNDKLHVPSFEEYCTIAKCNACASRSKCSAKFGGCKGGSSGLTIAKMSKTSKK